MDPQLEAILEQSMGMNVRKQIETVEPSFFEEKYVVLKLEPDPEKQGQFPAFIVPQRARVVASTNPAYPAGTTLTEEVFLPAMMEAVREGYNVAASPSVIHPPLGQGFQDILERGPYNLLAIGKVAPGATSLEEINFFYQQRGIFPHLSHRLDIDTFGTALARQNTHFAFLPKKEGEEVKPVYISDRNWELKGLGAQERREIT